MMRLLVIMLLLGLALPGAGAAEKPNILWLCADDLAPYMIGAYGDRQAATPNIDALAARGVRFDRAYCNSPVCTASRQSFLTGQYPRTLGVTQLRTALPAGTVTLATLLKDAGYSTTSIGKMHFNSALKHGFETRIDMPEHRKAMMSREKKPIPSDLAVLPPWKPFQDPARVWLNSMNLPYPAYDADMPGTFFTEQAEQFLGRKQDKPFFLMVSWYEPHSPFHYPIEFRGTVSPKTIVPARPGPEDDWHIPEIFRNITAEEASGITAAYKTSVRYLDRNVGRVLTALKKAGLDDNTVIVFTGDHGYMLGHHGRFEKHCSFEPAVRSPLIIRTLQGMSKPGSASSALVEFIDICPTLLTAAGVPIPQSVQGQPLQKVLTKPTERHRDQVVVEYSENEEAMIRDDRWKLIYLTGKRDRQDGYKTGKPLPGRKILLYDTQTDPDEQKNLANQPDQADRVASMIQKLALHMKRTARQPDQLPTTEDVHKLLEYCLAPRDVPTAANKK